MKNAGLEEAQAGNKIAGWNINNLRYADDTTLMTESKDHNQQFTAVLQNPIHSKHSHHRDVL